MSITLTVNLEAPGKGSFDVLSALDSVFLGCTIKVRSQETIYPNPDGDNVTVRTFIAKVFDAYPSGGKSIKEKLADVSEVFGQDCVAYKLREYGTCVADLAGPRADKWLPFSNEFFLEY